VSAYAGQLFGGTIGTSYHDVLQAAGLVDSAALHYRNWPHYDPEQLLQLDPEVIVAATTSAAQFCGISGLDHLRACAHGAAGVIGVDEALMSDPGLGMLDAAEALRARVYGEP
jgi:iron complex transport system substrate-binding protein